MSGEGTPPTIDGHIAWRNVITFLAIAFAGSWTIEISATLVPAPPAARLGIAGALAMFVPAFAAYLVRGPLLHEGFGDAGLQPHLRTGWRVYVVAYAAVPLLIASGIAVALASGLQHLLFPPRFSQLGITQTVPIHTLVLGAIFAFSVALPINMIFTFGEEFGWRGYLVPKLAPLGRAQSALITGTIWGVWHAPLVALFGLNFPGHPVAGIAMMTLFTIALGVFEAWLRYASDSIWPAVLAHACLNAQAGFAVVLLTPADSLSRAPTGVLGILPFACLAAWLLATNRLLDHPRTTRAFDKVQAQVLDSRPAIDALRSK